MYMKLLLLIYLLIYSAGIYSDCVPNNNFPLRTLCLDSVSIYLDNFLTKAEVEKKSPQQQVREHGVGGFPYREFTSPYGPPYSSMYSPKQIGEKVTIQATYLKADDKTSNLAAFGSPSGILVVLNPENVSAENTDLVEVTGKIELYKPHLYGDELGIRVEDAKLLFTPKQKESFFKTGKNFLIKLRKSYKDYFQCFRNDSFPTSAELLLWDNQNKEIVFPIFTGKGRITSKFYLVLDPERNKITKLYGSCTIYYD